VAEQLLHQVTIEFIHLHLQELLLTLFLIYLLSTLSSLAAGVVVKITIRVAEVVLVGIARLLLVKVLVEERLRNQVQRFPQVTIR
jgi:hypothetical protein